MVAQHAMAVSELSIRPTLAEVRQASDWLARDGAAHGVPQADLGRLDLCLNEALANVIAHGGTSAAQQPIHLRLQVHAREASVTVSDAGPAFDATTAALAVQATRLADATPGGLGLLMLRKFSDDLTYHRHDDQNVLTVTVRWA